MHPGLHLRRDLVVGVDVVADDLHIDRRWQPEIQHLANDISGLKIALDIGKIVLEKFADLFVHSRESADDSA